jgi:glycosyltransferase involved in cell wall biosynthesis
MKKLSVLVPSYNFEKYIIECVDSIYRQQTNFEFDVIVRDDCSTDNTNEKLIYLQKKYPSLIVLDGSKN